jgi:hypothetical protein
MPQPVFGRMQSLLNNSNETISPSLPKQQKERKFIPFMSSPKWVRRRIRSLSRFDEALLNKPSNSRVSSRISEQEGTLVVQEEEANMPAYAILQQATLKLGKGNERK